MLKNKKFMVQIKPQYIKIKSKPLITEVENESVSATSDVTNLDKGFDFFV